MNALPLDHDACWRAVQARDARFDGRFFTGVTTTGIYCRPTCPARTPKPGNVRFFASAAAAEGSGFRPCLRCRPETAPGSPAWSGTGAVAARALSLIQQGALDGDGVDALAERLGLGARHLRRLLLEHAGATPLSLALTRRLHFARRLLRETALPVEMIATASGFRTASRFRHAFRDAFGGAPSALRRASAALRKDAPIELALAVRAPFDGRTLFAFLAARAIATCEEAGADWWRTSARFGRDRGVVEVRLAPTGVLLRVSPSLAPHLLDVVARVRRMLDLDCDPHAIASRLRGDAALRALVKRRPGLRSPSSWDPFRSAVRIVVGQQVSVAAASTIAGRIARDFGETFAGEGSLTRLFPGPERLADAPLERCGIPSRRAEALRRFARGVASKSIALSPGCDDALRALPGFGEWTVSAIAMRALGDPDAFPAGDLVLARALGGERAARERSEAWRPFRAYAAMHLWTAAAKGAT